MIKKSFNQNDKFVRELINYVEPNFDFNFKPINRLKADNKVDSINKNELLMNLKKQIYSIQNCNLKENSKNIVLGDGKFDSSLMFVGEAPGEEEDLSGLTFQGEVRELLKKMLNAINIKIEDVYLSYAVNYRPPEDRKPTSQEIKRYSIFLKEHISIINPEIIVLMGSTAMESLIGSDNKISNERGIWKEIILNNKTIPIMTTFSPSYLIRYPEKKKFSWEDLKKIRQKIKDLNIKI